MNKDGVHTFEQISKGDCDTLSSCRKQFPRTTNFTDKNYFKVLEEPKYNPTPEEFILGKLARYPFTKEILLAAEAVLKDVKDKNQTSKLQLKVLKEALLIHPDFDLRLKSNSRQFSSIRDAIEAELVECGRTVYVSYTDELVGYKSYLERAYVNLSFTMSNSILPKFMAIFLEKGTNIDWALSAVFESGLLSEGLNQNRKRDSSFRWANFTGDYSKNFSTTVKPQNLNDNIQTVFYLYALINGLAGFCFWMEARKELKVFVANAFSIIVICAKTFIGLRTNPESTQEDRNFVKVVRFSVFAFPLFVGLLLVLFNTILHLW